MNAASLPEGWRAVPLGDVTADQRIGTTRRGENGRSTLPLLKMGNVLWGSLDLDDIEPIDAAWAIEDGATLSAGDILFNTRNTPQLVGKTAYWPAPFDAAFDNNLMRIRVGERADSRYVAAWMGSATGQIAIGRFVCASTSVGAVYWRDLANLLVPVPSFAEQQRIVAVLDAWENAISAVASLEQAERKHRRVRVLFLLDNAGGDQRRLDELGTFRSAGVDKLVRAEQNTVRLLNFTDAFHRTLVWSDDLNHEVSASEREIRECNIREGDVFFTPSSETRKEIGYAAVAAEDMDNAVYSYHVVRFRPHTDTLDKLFSSVMFDTDEFYRQAYVLCDGSGQRYVLSLDDFRSMTVTVPGLDVQRRIGLFAEASMAANRARRDELALLRRQKRGLMRKLLTGEWRVPETGDAFAPGGPAADRLEAPRGAAK